MFRFLFRLFGRGKNDIAPVNISNEDDSMNRAIEKARHTLHHFIEVLKNNDNYDRYVSVKVKIVDGDNVEHIWLGSPEFDNDGNLFGIVGNDPVYVTNVKLDQKIGIAEAMISDWMIVENGRLIGGYTIRAIRDAITSERERRKFDQQIGGLWIDEGEDYYQANFDTPEGAIVSIENAYDSGDIDRILACKDFGEEAKLLMQKDGMLEKLPEADRPQLLATVAETLKLSMIKSLTENGMPHFGGCKRAFPYSEKRSDNHRLITEIITHPDGTRSMQKIHTYLTIDGWRVLHAD